MSLVEIPEDLKFQELLKKKIPMRFSCFTNSGWPVILSLWYLQRGDEFFCATQKNAKVIDYLKQNPKCAFEIARDKPPYLGIRGRGKVVLREDLGEEILEELILRYLGDKNSTLAKYLLDQSKNEVAIEIIPMKIFTWDYSGRMEGIK